MSDGDQGVTTWTSCDNHIYGQDLSAHGCWWQWTESEIKLNYDWCMLLKSSEQWHLSIISRFDSYTRQSILHLCIFILLITQKMF